MAMPASALALFQGFQSLCEHSPDAISLINEQGVITYTSAAHTKLFGYRPDQLLGRKFTELVHPDDGAQPLAALLDVLRSPSTPIHWESRAKIIDKRSEAGFFWAENTICNLLSDFDVRAIVLYQRDITVRKAAEEARLLHATELARSNTRLEEFAYTAAHDLREPLRTMSLYTEVLAETVTMNPEADKIVTVIRGSASRMFTLIDDLLSYARTGKHAPPQKVDLAHAAAQAIKNLGSDITASNAIVKLGPLPVVHSDEIQLVRLFQNLIGNAVKYRDTHQLKVQVTAEQRGVDWQIKVQDNGLGIPLDQQQRVFNPFVRLASRDIPGTGLGLAVCKKIVEDLGGRIWLDSKPGVGSTFSFTLPREQ